MKPITREYAQLNQQETISLARAQQFLSFYFADVLSDDEAYAEMRRTANFNPTSLEEGIHAIEALLVPSTPDLVLIELVLWSANQPLDAPNGDTAKAWLQEVIAIAQTISNPAK
ncbi:MAG: hypothetical protein QNJ72_06560 [Pleurocapsa sp. MO_226.B13]|nr:hypothetical protein [Pleurocapsa sp. MO_226.B13]